MANRLYWKKRRLSYGWMVVIVLMAGSVMAHEGHDHPIAVKPADMYRPTAMPDRIVMTFNGDPRTARAVTWRTSTEVHKGLAEIAIAEGGPMFREKASQIEAECEALKTDINTAHFHSVTFKDLKAGTKYVYRVGDGSNWSEWFHFSTAPADDKPFSFIYFGDAQNDLRSMWSRVIREAYSDAPKAAFMLHAGDLVNRAEADAEWGEWFGAGHWVNAMIPSVPVPGNHEIAKSIDGKSRLSRHWRPQFTLPTDGPRGLEETCYSLVFGNTRIVCMNSNDDLDVQAEWLDRTLAKNQSRWTICTFHHPVFSTAKDRDNAALRACWKPILDKYKVDLVLQGHDHTYGRTGLQVPSEIEGNDSKNKSTGAIASTVANVATGLNSNDPQSGTVYVVSVSGPKMYNLQKQPFMKRVGEDTQLYQVIHVNGDTLRYEARNAIGQLYDAFELRKRPHQLNELVEIEPEVAEHLRPLQVGSEGKSQEAKGAETKPSEKAATEKAAVVR